ncbi:HlyD family efflux transporter periplasmic adaptor subunit [Qingshengfaniella alkalisoli]|uniref:HlyD family efflux transporter periplasmic adaptor subunit n=2 Tax=Qingshengfaniella alkalisoli TaxID=2599296 RepID=A0A5B8J748_9RHOB|nr:HlyD family efflux transporter periplasmic adaptor subunit [Qingshengfaniella alkalisoli]
MVSGQPISSKASRDRTVPRADARKPNAVELLLRIESELRQVESVQELKFVLANETPVLSRASQVFVVSVKGRRRRVEAVTGIGVVERNAPRIRWIEAVIGGLAEDAGLQARRDFRLPAYAPPEGEHSDSFPYPFMLWVPFILPGGHVFGGLLLARERPWSDSDVLVSERVAETGGYCWAAMAGKRRLKRRVRIGPVLAALVICLVAAGFVPVPLTVLAPAQVVSVEPRIIAAPLDGTIDSIAVDPNAEVAAEDELFRMSDTTLRNDLAVAEQEVRVAEADFKRIAQSAVTDPSARADFAVARTELSLATARRDYAQELLNRTVVAAPAAGVVIYGDRREWIGRPVQVGERLMEIADPTRVQLRIDVPVADSIVMREGASARAFLDSDPLKPVPATVISASFEAQRTEEDVMAYRIYARFSEDHAPMQLGTRGTAQIYGEQVSLAYYLFRKPLAAARQWLGQ